MFKLVIEDDEGNKTVVPVIRDEISIGRQEGNTIRLTERNVSRRHARLLRNQDNSIVFEELDTRYGTRKNGEKISGRADFVMGDVFVVGDYRLTLQGETPPGVKGEAPAKPNGIHAPPPPNLPKPSGGFSNQATQITRRENVERRSNDTEIIPSAPAKIVVVSSNFAGQEFPLTHKEMVIGRGEEADIIIDHRSVSQAHAKIIREASGTYKIVDLNSKNGIKVSGEEYKAVHLKRGDIIELGHVKFRFVEPNENYVFTPQSMIEDDDAVAVAPQKNKTLLMAALGGLVVVALVVIGYAATQIQTKGDEVVTTTPAVVKPTTTSVEPQLAKAEEELKAGNADRAIVVLELARDTMTPNAEEKTRISEMLSQARREKPLEAALKESRAYFNDKRYVDALRRLKSIPPDDSIIAKLVKEEKLVESSIEQILSQAHAAIQEGDLAEADALVEEILVFDAKHTAALALRDEARGRKPVEVVAVTKKPHTKVATKTTPIVTKKPAMTEAERSEIVKEARQALVAGDQAKAIDLCKNIRHPDCYRVLGVAYKNLGKMPKACENFKKAGQQVAECE